METYVKKFVVGKTYATRSICEHDIIIQHQCIGRTERTVTFFINGRPKRKKIEIKDREETCKPYGKYSMSPTFRAGKTIAYFEEGEDDG